MADADRGTYHFAWSRRRSAIVITGRRTEAWGLNAHTHALRFSTPVTKPPASVSLRTTACFRTEKFKTLNFM